MSGKSDTATLCDCERSHNGLGMAGRLCDCQDERPPPPGLVEAALLDESTRQVAEGESKTAAPWRPTHRLLAQSVRLLGRLDDRYLVEHPDGSMGWITGWPHERVVSELGQGKLNLGHPNRAGQARFEVVWPIGSRCCRCITLLIPARNRERLRVLIAQNGGHTLACPSHRGSARTWA